MLFTARDFKGAQLGTTRAFSRVKNSKDTLQELIDKMLHYGLAWAYLKEGEFKQAIEEFQRIVNQTEDKVV